jgi:hypothetical protein
LLLAAGCSADFSAALRVTLSGPEPGTGGGYWVSLRRPDGAPIEGATEKFVAFAPGAQEFAVVLKRADVFAGSATASARLNVRAVNGREAPTAARGSAVVMLKRGDVVTAAVTLAADPRPLSGTVAAAYERKEDARGDEVIALSATGLPDGHDFHVWLEGSAGPRWAGVIAGGAASISPSAHATFIATERLRLLVTAEPAGSPTPLAAPSGWRVFSGELNANLVSTLVTAPQAGSGYITAVMSALDTTESHRSLALDAIGYQSAADARQHCEHVYATVGGVEGAGDEEHGGPGDFTGDGRVEHVHPDRTGLGANDDQGYRKLLKAALTGLESDFSGDAAYLDANACRVHLSGAVDDALDKTAFLAGQPLSRDKDAFSAAVDRLRGNAYVPGQPGRNDDNQTLRCLEGALAALARLTLGRTEAGKD